MNIIDSSAWLEYFANSKSARHFSNIVEDPKNLIVPSVVVYEVFKKIIIERDYGTALKIVAHMQLGRVVDFNMELALMAASLSREHHLPMADSMILATARKYNAVIWTIDADFEGLEGVKYFKKD